MSRRRKQQSLYAGRNWFVFGIIITAFAGLAMRAAWLQVIDNAQLKQAGLERHLRKIKMPAKRGMILDRQGEPLAVSSPMQSASANPKEFMKGQAKWPALAKLLDVKHSELEKLASQYAAKEFMYLKRHLNPNVAEQVRDLKVPGVQLRREYKRYYPLQSVTSHVVGFTDIDDRGQEGVELKANDSLAGQHGMKRVLQDRRGTVVEDYESVTRVEDGRDITLSIDTRIQYEALRQLERAITKHRATSGSVVVLDVLTGEILAMVNKPDFNPNQRRGVDKSFMRNRAVTDVFEPGSTLKPFAIVQALDAGGYSANTMVQTGPGLMKVGRNVVRDIRNYGDLTVSDVIVKSSNVGMAKIILSMGNNALVNFLDQLGLGQSVFSGLPGEVGGQLNTTRKWKPIERATLAFGYGTSVTPLQLARLYGAIARGGELIPVSIERRTGAVQGSRVFSKQVATQVTRMLEQVCEAGGTGHLARVPLYRVAGKTGTAKKLVNGKYADKLYRSLFAGFAPASSPRVSIAVMIDEPKGKQYYGGQVAAPVFQGVMSAALRLLNVPPDQHATNLDRTLVQN